MASANDDERRWRGVDSKKDLDHAAIRPREAARTGVAGSQQCACRLNNVAVKRELSCGAAGRSGLWNKQLRAQQVWQSIGSGNDDGLHHGRLIMERTRQRGQLCEL